VAFPRGGRIQKLNQQIASWFDLDFNPRETMIPPHAVDDEATVAAWDYNVMPPAATWSWLGSADNGMNPGPTPRPPNRGLKVTLSTGPDGK
jgi:hypothetical protein